MTKAQALRIAQDIREGNPHLHTDYMVERALRHLLGVVWTPEVLEAIDLLEIRLGK